MAPPMPKPGPPRVPVATPEVLQHERDRLANAVVHLERSVVELKLALEESGPDPDFQDAIGEDIVVIASYRARIAKLDEAIALAKGETPPSTSGAAGSSACESRPAAEPMETDGPRPESQPAAEAGEPETKDEGAAAQRGEADPGGMWM